MAAERRLPRGRLLLPPFPHVAGIVPSPRAVRLVLLGLAVAGGGLAGWLAVTRGPVPAAALLVGLAGGVVVASDPRAAVWVVLGVVTLLPFAVIPVRLGLTLTLLELSALAALGVWLLRLLLRRDERIVAAAPGAWIVLLLRLLLRRDARIVAAAPGAWIVLLLAVTLFAFLLGVNNGYTPETYHDYGKFVLAVLLVFVVWNTTRSLGDARRLTTVVLLGGGAAAAIGLALYAGGASLTLRVLSHLIRYGYPSTRIVRYIEDNPAKQMRLVGTSVDPNSFGGLLAVVFVLASAQAISRNRLVGRWLTVPVAGLSGAALLLTYSRGAWLGAAAGLVVLALFRYRWLIAPGVVVGALALLVGLGASFLHRLWLGLTLQDPATKLRLEEYRNALAIIRSHPLFGVGFGAAPSIQQQTGVSSIYLTVAEQAGFLGVAAFLLAVGAVGLAGLRHWRRSRASAAGDLQLALLAALASALVVGVFDHYYFDITFPHMAALFWSVCGLILALAHPPGAPATASGRIDAE